MPCYHQGSVWRGFGSSFHFLLTGFGGAEGAFGGVRVLCTFLGTTVSCRIELVDGTAATGSGGAGAAGGGGRGAWGSGVGAGAGAGVMGAV